MPHTNLQVYKEIVYEAFFKMLALDEEAITPKSDGGDGGDGNIIKYDPDHQSFKQAMIVVVFSGMWLEAFFHQEIVNQQSKNQFNIHNKKSYKEKLELIGINDTSTLNKAVAFQKTRNELIHEKAFLDRGDPKLAQVEAKRAHGIIEYVASVFAQKG